MKVFTFKEFVEKTPGKLDSLHGNKGLDDYSLIAGREAVEDKRLVAEIKELSETFKEEVWYVDKGRWPLLDFIHSLSDEELSERSGYAVLNFEQEVRVYFMPGRNVFMNVARVILPPKKTITPKTKRVFVLRDGYNFYLLPLLTYPSSVKDFLKWLKKKKKIKFNPGDAEIWNHDENYQEGYDLHYHPMKNIKSEDDIAKYNEWLVTDYKEYTKADKTRRWRDFNPEAIKKISPIKLTEITQLDITDFCNDQNNRFKIQRK